MNVGKRNPVGSNELDEVFEKLLGCLPSYVKADYYLDIVQKHDSFDHKHNKEFDLIIFGTGIPEELIYASGTKPYWILGGSHSLSAFADDFVPRDTDPVSCATLDDVRRVTHFARQNELLFAKHITQKNSSEIRRDITQTERELEIMRRRDTELTALFKRLYGDNVPGKIQNEVFRKLSDDYLAEQKEIQSSIPEREERLKKLKGSVANVSVFLEKAKEYTKLDTLTAELLHLFIEKVVVGERGEIWSRTAVQEIHIYYRDIGLLGDLNAQPMESAAVPEPQEVA